MGEHDAGGDGGSPTRAPGAAAAAGNPAKGADHGRGERPRAKRRRPPHTAREQSADESVDLDEDGRERPAFLRAFPRDPGLDRAVAAFERGDFAGVRRHAERLASEAPSPRVRRAAQELLARIQPDLLAKLLLAVALGLWLCLVAWTYSHAP